MMHNYYNPHKWWEIFTTKFLFYNAFRLLTLFKYGINQPTTVLLLDYFKVGYQNSL